MTPIRLSNGTASLLILCGVVAGCGSSSTDAGPTEGRLEITAATDSAPPGLFRYTLQLDGVDGPALRADDVIVLERVSAGEHRVGLFGVPAGCAIEGVNPRTVIVEGSVTTAIRFSVICVPPVISGFRLVVSTSGGRPDENGYVVTVSEAPPVRMAAQDTLELVPLSPGTHLVTLTDVADHCQVQGDNPRRANVVPGKRVQLRLPVACAD